MEGAGRSGVVRRYRPYAVWGPLPQLSFNKPHMALGSWHPLHHFCVLIDERVRLVLLIFSWVLRFWGDASLRSYMIFFYHLLFIHLFTFSFSFLYNMRVIYREEICFVAWSIRELINYSSQSLFLPYTLTLSHFSSPPTSFLPLLSLFL